MADHELVLSVVIPAHNEESNVAHTILGLEDALRKAAIPFEIVAVNDNSTDDTIRVLTDLTERIEGLRLISRKPPSGFGRAVRAALDQITGDVIAVYMADQSDDPADLIRCYQRLEEGYDCAFGTRFAKGTTVENYPWFKLIVNRIVNRAIQIMFWTRHNDLTNAFKVYRTHVVRQCGPYKSSHFNLTIEMSLSALIRRYSIASVPINWYGRTAGVSNLKISQMGRRYLAVLLHMFFERILISDDLMAERLYSRLSENQRRTSLELRVAALEKRLSELDSMSGQDTADA